MIKPQSFFFFFSQVEIICIATIFGVYILLLSQCCYLQCSLGLRVHPKLVFSNPIFFKVATIRNPWCHYQIFNNADVVHPKVSRLVFASKALHLLSVTSIDIYFPNGLCLFLAETL